MKIINIPDHKSFQAFNYTQKGVAAPFSLGDVVIDPLGEVSVIIQGFGEDDCEYRGDMNGVQTYEGTRHATKEEIINLRIDIWNYIQKNRIDALCKSVIDTLPIFWDNPNGAQETICPFCNAVQKGQGEYFSMYDLQHEDDCAFNIAKTLIND